MEYNFWFDTETEKLSLALHARGSHRKIAVSGSVLAHESIQRAGETLIMFLNSHSVGGRQVKSVIIRSSQSGSVGVVLFCTDKTLKNIDFSSLGFSSFKLYYSNPKSPASVATELLSEYGAEYLEDQVLTCSFRYSPEGFFQVNISMYEEVLKDMVRFCKESMNVVDMYAGVGSIGLSLPHKKLISIELDRNSSTQASMNAQGRANATVVLSESEQALAYISRKATLIVDPPRAGLHKNVTEKIIEQSVPLVLYLSCNPATQVRDIKRLYEAGYKAVFARGYNFFPATPHIESLVILNHD